MRRTRSKTEKGQCEACGTELTEKQKLSIRVLIKGGVSCRAYCSDCYAVVKQTWHVPVPKYKKKTPFGGTE